jgi:hypothetical protein
VATDKGWIKLYRQLLNKAIWQCSTMEQKVILITLLLMANHEEKEWEWQGEKFKCKPGQFVTSLKSIAEKAGSDISIQNVRTAIAKFEKYEFLTNQSTKTGRLITIVNWELYQSQDSKLTKGLTKHQQSANKALTTNKNDKNDKNDKKKIIGDFTQNPKLITAINDFMEMRTKIKKPMTDRAVELLLGKLSTMADTDEEKIALLEQSTANSWLSVYPLKQTNRKGGQVIGNKRRLSRQDERDWEKMLGID